MFLHTRMVVREESLNLYGFESAEERELFDLLLQVNGVGPRWRSRSSRMLRWIACRRRWRATSRSCCPASGCWRKTAEKIIFQLRDKVSVTLMPSPELLEADATFWES